MMTTIPLKSFASALGAISCAVSFFASATEVKAGPSEQIVAKLATMKFGHNKGFVATSKDRTIAPSKLYHYKISGTIRGKGGALGLVYREEIPIATFLDSLKAGTSSLLEGSLDNPDGALPALLVSKNIEGSRNIKGVGRVKLNLKFAGTIDAKGQIALEVSDVKATVNGKPLDGVMVIGKGSKLDVSTSPIIQFKATTMLVNETVGNASVKVVRLGNKVGSASVQFQTADGTAVAGVDYDATTGTVQFASGETSKNILVPIINNTVKDGFRKFTITLSDPATGTILGVVPSNTVSIANDD